MIQDKNPVREGSVVGRDFRSISQEIGRGYRYGIVISEDNGMWSVWWPNVGK